MCSGMNLKRIDALIKESESELKLVRAEIKRIEKKMQDSEMGGN